ncbi:hypothetical protein KHQ08_17815 (plasmid) [Pseudochrobactrum algeriensis]|uniref:hypothetical protein n=2 Tax=Pseudochrobactrum algeriensis TaxID=2834768 RepID=UPI001BD18F7D|nr:hypothetical protein [Pseudochrobactrum algeriensis]QVQ38611.1 hypothetical protein KHQ08_17815 [Pseudochrobactrum algeriensis]QVQ38744.1 hypothetical protein KHQ07_00065 [Pseudochrobactrum algeriensis]QVQ42287.1 hypothetical protein KHQ09_00170 [Pseudochrobactrum algeriensis]
MKKTAQLLVKMSPDLREAFHNYALRHGRSASALIRHLMEDEMRNARMIDMLKPKLLEGQCGPVAEIFDDKGKAYHVKVMPYRTQTILHILDPGCENGIFDLSKVRGGSTLLNKIFSVIDTAYDWNTPSYRQICQELGLDPDFNRPTYKEADKPLVANLERHIKWDAGGEDMRLNELTFDLLDLLRTDQYPEFYAFIKSKQSLDHWSFKVSKSVFENAFNRVDQYRIRSSQPVFTSIDFLPSWEGRGYSASIDLWSLSTCASDGWVPQKYGHLKGVALKPMRFDLAIETVVRRLKDQGVVFLTDIEARDYLNEEGAYWAFQQRSWQCPNGLQPRLPSAAEKLLWRIKHPATPLYDQHIKRIQIQH